MELILTRQNSSATITISCDGQHSHTFDLHSILPGSKTGLPQPLDDPETYGTALYHALFPDETPAGRAVANSPERILFVSGDDEIDALPWEYAYDPVAGEFLVTLCHFVRSLSAEQRIEAPLLEQSLHIIAVPSNPLSQQVAPLNIDGEWERLKEIINGVPFACTLERTRPPTIEQLRSLVAGQRQRVIHFMGHGGQSEQGATLCFEQDNGDLDQVTARQFALRVRNTTFLVTLNACVSATPGRDDFSNLANALVRQKVPYALGMRTSIHDNDARSFSRSFYDDLARGVPVEEALLQARLTLSQSKRRWAAGIPVLYTCLKQPAPGFICREGTPTVKEYQPRLEVTSLPRALGTFQGRSEDLKRLGSFLTGDSRKRIITIHAGGGQGKTALAREVVERFAYAWSGGVWTTSLEHLPNRSVFASDLAHFLGIETQDTIDLDAIEHSVLTRLAQQRTLIVLDNAETLVEAVEQHDVAAFDLAQFLQHLPGPTVSLLLTSRIPLGWAGEQAYELGGLSSEEGAALFRACAPQRTNEIEPALAHRLSEKLWGHPLGLRLLAGAFNASPIALSLFITEYQDRLVQAADLYKSDSDRHRTLITCIETSVRYLDKEPRTLLSKLWIFHAPFLPETATAIFEPDREENKDAEGTPSSTEEHLYLLWQRGLLMRETATLREGMFHFYYLLPTTRPYIEQHLKQADEEAKLLQRYGADYAQLVTWLSSELDRGSVAATIAQLAREDIELGISQVTGSERGHYLNHWGWILYRLGKAYEGLARLEQALEIAQGEEPSLQLHVSNNLALVYRSIGQPQHALQLFEVVLSITREVRDRAGEATAINNLAGIYQSTGQPQRALQLLKSALSITRKVGDRAKEATTLHNLAAVYQDLGHLRCALQLLKSALSIMREVGNRTGEAYTLNRLALVYRSIGQPQHALPLFEAALPITREVGDRAEEAAILNGLALVYQSSGQPQHALQLFEAALPITREIGDRIGEVATLNNLAEAYRNSGQPQSALQLFEAALPIIREIGNPAGEAAILNNLALLYQGIGQLQHALQLFEAALPITREIGDRIGEATILNGLAYLFQKMQRYEEATAAFERSINLSHKTFSYASEAAGLARLALHLHTNLNRPQEAMVHMEQAIAILREMDLPQDAAGQTSETLSRYLQTIQNDVPQQPIKSILLPMNVIQQVVINTISVMTTAPERRSEWRAIVLQHLQFAQQQGENGRNEFDFFSAVIAILDGQSPTLSPDHPYVQVVMNIHDGIARGGIADEDEINLPQLILHNTLAVLGPAPQYRATWLDNLTHIRDEATETNARDFVAWLDAVIALVIANGNPTDLGINLTSNYTELWQQLIAQLDTQHKENGESSL